MLLSPPHTTQLFLKECGAEGRGLAASAVIRKGTKLLQLPGSLLLTAAVAAQGEDRGGGGLEGPGKAPPKEERADPVGPWEACDCAICDPGLWLRLGRTATVL